MAFAEKNFPLYYTQLKMFFLYLLGEICGDFCIYKGDTCFCGQQAFSKKEMGDQDVYCCAPDGSCEAEKKS